MKCKLYMISRKIRSLLNTIRGEQSLSKLIRKGLIIGENPTIMSGCIIDPSHCWHIEIGDNVILAPRVHILAHDASTKDILGYTRVSNVRIGNNVFIGAGSIVLPGVDIGDRVVIGAGSVVTRSISSNSVAAGNPARIICTFDEYFEKFKMKITKNNSFGDEYTFRNPEFSEQQRAEMKTSCEKYGEIFVK